jgi:Tfp pilus assembly protein PilX
MPERKNPESGVILLVVVSVILVVVILSGVVLTIVNNQSRLTNHQVSRIRAFYAGKGIMNYTLEKLRLGTWAAHATTTRYVCYSNVVGGNCSSLGASAPYYDTIPVDSDIPYKALVVIYSQAAYPNGRIDIKTDYTYTPS